MFSFSLQLKQFQKSGKNSPKARDSKAAKKNSSDSVVSNKELIHSEVNSTNTNLDTVTDPVNVNSFAEGDTAFSSETDHTIISNQVTEDLYKETTEVTVVDNKASEETSNQQTFAQVCAIHFTFQVCWHSGIEPNSSIYIQHLA